MGASCAEAPAGGRALWPRHASSPSFLGTVVETNRRGLSALKCRRRSRCFSSEGRSSSTVHRAPSPASRHCPVQPPLRREPAMEVTRQCTLDPAGPVRLWRQRPEGRDGEPTRGEADSSNRKNSVRGTEGALKGGRGYRGSRRPGGEG